LRLIGARTQAKAKRPISDHPRIYADWVETPNLRPSLLQRARKLKGFEKRAVAQWSAAAQDWGMSATCVAAQGSDEILVEVYGPMELVPIAAIYPDGDDGFLYELYNGEILEAATIEEALAFALP
jgi:hypothetical protein